MERALGFRSSLSDRRTGVLFHGCMRAAPTNACIARPIGLLLFWSCCEGLAAEATSSGHKREVSPSFLSALPPSPTPFTRLPSLTDAHVAALLRAHGDLTALTVPTCPRLTPEGFTDALVTLPPPPLPPAAVPRTVAPLCTLQVLAVSRLHLGDQELLRWARAAGSAPMGEREEGGREGMGVRRELGISASTDGFSRLYRKV